MMSKIPYHSNRGQGMMLVMQALEELRGSNTKNDVLTYVNESRYYEITRFDLPPYPNQNEPKYHTLLAWARKDIEQRGWLLYEGRDAWALNGGGLAKIKEFRGKTEKEDWDVRKCYLWTPRFKKLMCSTYVPSALDAERPAEQSLEDLLGLV